MPFRPALNEVVLHVPGQPGWLHFRRPSQVIAARRVADVLAVLQEVEEQVTRRGMHAAGFLSYEAAPAMDPAFQVLDPFSADADPAAPAPSGAGSASPGPASAASASAAPPPTPLPLAWFGLYPPPERLPPSALAPDGTAPALLPGPWQPSVAEGPYQQAIRQIKDHIARGETYQVNYTYRLHTQTSLADGGPSAWALFTGLALAPGAQAAAAPYAAFVESEDWAILSISPELFFTLDGETLSSRPMKGTAPRGRTLEEDQALAEWLHHSEKNRAENLMILDMVRNDMGRVARTGSVRVPELFRVEKYPTVWQMTSTATAQTAAPLPELMQSLFPAASITGAPKVRTMQIIAALETAPRQIYTGAIGCYAPGRRAQFNVAIRTLLLDKRRGAAQYGVGGGIVWDSEPADEWQETITKARILHERPQPFDLFETMLWRPTQGWFLLDQHLARLARSAEYFAFPLDQAALAAELERLQAALRAEGNGEGCVVRLLLAPDGALRFETRPRPPTPNPARVGIAKNPVRSTDRFLFHKTTRREVFRRAAEERPGFDDLLLWNERGEITEATIANVVCEREGRLLTPPVTCGLLPGAFRAWLLETGQVTEQPIRLSELAQCTRVFLTNSVRGMWEVQVVGLGDE